MDNVIAIDGPAASGKSSIAERLAERLGIPYVNTGNMYRAVTLAAMKKGFSADAPDYGILRDVLKNISLDYVAGPDGKLVLKLDGSFVDSEIRQPEVAKCVSVVAAFPDVREWLVERQRKFAGTGMIVMEGRDIGTVVFPNAKYKFFLTATPEVRAVRRLKQEGESSEGATVASVAAEIAKRDEMDMNRKVSPLKKADDAILVDSSDMTIEQVLDFIVEHIEIN